MKTTMPLASACSLANCDGYFHRDGGCSTVLGRQAVTGNTVGNLDVEIELYDCPDDGLYLSVLGLDAGDGEAFLSRLRSREDAIVLARQFASLAKAIEDAGSQLAAAQALKAVAL